MWTSQGTCYLSGKGPRTVVEHLRVQPSLYLAVTGSFAAAQRQPIAAPAQLTAYVEDFQASAGAAGLLPADYGADVILLEPYDQVVTERSVTVDSLKVVAPSQLTLDCLAGNGRMPSEGEALI